MQIIVTLHCIRNSKGKNPLPVDMEAVSEVIECSICLVCNRYHIAIEVSVVIICDWLNLQMLRYLWIWNTAHTI